MARPPEIKPRIARAIADAKNPVLFTGDFEAYGSRRQVLRILGNLAEEGVIARIGFGVYARLTYSKHTGRTGLEYSLTTLAREFVRRVGARVVPTDEEFARFRGLSTQVPVGRVIGVNKRISRRLTYRCPAKYGIWFELVPDGVERLAELGVDEMYTPVAELK